MKYCNIILTVRHEIIYFGVVKTYFNVRRRELILKAINNKPNSYHLL